MWNLVSTMPSWSKKQEQYIDIQKIETYKIYMNQILLFILKNWVYSLLSLLKP